MIYSLSIAKNLRSNIAISSFVWWVPVGMTMDHIPFMVDFYIHICLDYIPICFVWLQNPKFWLVKTHMFFFVGWNPGFFSRSQFMLGLHIAVDAPFNIPLFPQQRKLGVFSHSKGLVGAAKIRIAKVPTFPGRGTQARLPKVPRKRFPSKVPQQGS